MKNLRKEFPFFTHNPKTIYFDSGATSLKPKVVGEAEKEYLEKVGANPQVKPKLLLTLKVLKKLFLLVGLLIV